jgi:hypothetical protein
MNTAENKEDYANAITAARGSLSEVVALYEKAEDEDTLDDWDAMNRITDRVLELPLSVQVRSGWFSPWDDIAKPDDLAECRILLATGGPAVQVWAELDGYGEPAAVELQVQDWFRPWASVAISGKESEALEWFVRQFNLGELY